MPRKKSGYSKKRSDWLGRPITEHFNSRGEKTGYSKQGTSFFGSPRTERYNAKGEKTGYSKKGSTFFGTPTKEYYNNKGEKTGYSKEGTSFLGAPIMERFDSEGKKIGQSKPGSTFFGTPIIEHYREQARPSSVIGSSLPRGFDSLEALPGSRGPNSGGRVLAVVAVLALLISFGIARLFVGANRPDSRQNSTSQITQVEGTTGDIAGRRLEPIDEAPQDQSFLMFRNEMLDAIKEKDSALLLSLISPTVEVGFGGDPNTVEEFAKVWHIDSPDSPLWDELGAALRMGGTFATHNGQRVFCAPYVSGAWPPDADPFSYTAVIARNVRLRARPDPNAPVLGTLSYNILKVVDWTADRHWVKVMTDNGTIGFVSAKFLRASIDYRAFFTQINGKWMLTAFVAGD
jgi:hypothetical protein